MFTLTGIMDKMLVEFGENHTEFIMSTENFDKLSEELNEVIPMEELNYKGYAVKKMDGIEQNKIYLR